MDHNLWTISDGPKDMVCFRISFTEPTTSKNRFGFEKTEEPTELEPFILHEPSPGSFIQLIPNFYSEDEEYSIFRKLLK